METKKHNSLDDLVFENKNKAYGAYYNRITAGFDLMKSLFITIFGIGALALVLSFTINNESGIVDDGGVIVILDPTITNPPAKEKDKPVEKDKPATKPKVVVDDKTDTPPTPVKNTDNQTEMRNHEDLSTVVSGDVESNGDESQSIKTPDNGNGNGTATNDDSGTGGVEQPEKTVFSPREVKEMAIFPGCERFAGNNEKLQDCMSEQLQNELGNQLSDFENIAHRQNINEAMAKVQFIIDKSGKIIDVKPLNGGNVELSKEAKQALERISKRMVQKGKFIKPAKFEDGTAVNVTFAIPVRFISN